VAEDMGFVHFESADTLIQIKLRKKENEALPLTMIKGLTDEMATGFYKGTILQSEILTVNGIEFFVSDIRGHWNGEEEVIGMFRYYFNAGSDSYNLLMRYPEKDIEKTKKLKYRMLESVKWGVNSLDVPQPPKNKEAPLAQGFLALNQKTKQPLYYSFYPAFAGLSD
jgi:hypothetical protein